MEHGSKDKMRVVKLFFNRFTYIGIILILFSILISFATGSLEPGVSAFLLEICADLLATIGIALLVGAIFDLAKNSEEFIESISRILSNIVVSKSFLNTLSVNDKRQALELILQPSGDQLQQYSTINRYFQKKIDENIAMFDTNFKSHLSLEVSAYKDKGDNKVKARSKLQYRIYKVNNRFQPIQTWFEHEGSEFLSTKIFCNSTVFEITKEDQREISEENRTKVPFTKTSFEVPEEYQNSPYVTVQYDIIEPGFDHWINFLWTTLTPCDGLNFSLSCEDGLVIKQHELFDDGDAYNVDLREDKKYISILSTEWINKFTGLSIIIGEESK